VLLPATAGGALVNAGVTLAGKIPVNLNFTSSAENIGHAVASCRIKKVITSKKFASRIEGLNVPAQLLYLEDIMASVTSAEKIAALLKARLVPARTLSGEAHNNPHDCATVVFSSGSTAHPKGIVLTHHNIISNIEQMSAVLDLSVEECMVASLPFFHSFGLTASLWFPLLCGFRVAYHPNPLDAATIATLARKERGTILLATPTFLQAYMRKATPEDFAAMRIIISGAEKLKPALASAFREKLGKDALEGYGATELSPVAALNVPDATHRGFTEKGGRSGTIGRLLPGMAARLVDPDTGTPAAGGAAGLLEVQGPNVMKEYLDDPEKTREAVRDGWYCTGDIASISADGYITITDRLARFSKIGGEMIPHGALEDILAAALQTAAPAVAVTAVPDPHRGEKLVVLYTAEAGGASALQQTIAAADIPNLWKPSADAYLQVEKIPMLGTGKTDLKGIKTLAVAAFERKN
jgi:acyl-[acyl-carrier-protein]-phospholipid O-acyltransferase/long-chain-fatty-acid--[acyl-carrier-protein] ligase